MNFELLRSTAGIRYLIFDKDNTLTLPYERDLHPSVAEVVPRLKNVFGSQNIAILSNSVGSKEDKDGKEAVELEALLGINVIRHEKKKPDVGYDILRHFAVGVRDSKT